MAESQGTLATYFICEEVILHAVVWGKINCRRQTCHHCCLAEEFEYQLLTGVWKELFCPYCYSLLHLCCHTPWFNWRGESWMP